ncbi:MAG: hypothetical protein PHQ53_06955 [Candidatus Krumholzibacteria bacterium]|nr:hypothetical protein [Candidatus Krumholzibacteria bacterium]
MQRTYRVWRLSAWNLAAVVVAGALALAPGRVAASDDWLPRDDWRQWLQAQEIGGRRSDARAASDSDDRDPHDLRRRIKAGALSLVLPGAGQYYNGQHNKALIMVGVEAAVWGTYLGFDRHADNLAGDYRNWAGVYAGTSGEHPDNFWRNVGRYSDSDAWYEASLRQARALGEAPPPYPGAGEEWQWRNDSYRVQYQDLRADANNAYSRRDKIILFAIVNRVVAVYDAVRHADRPRSDAPAGALATVGGLDLALEVSPSLLEPAARATASWRF